MLALEPLEDRCLLSVTAVPGFRLMPQHGVIGFASLPAGAYTPAEVRQAYGIDQIMDGGVLQDGAGMTIAIVDFEDDPRIVSRNSDSNVNQDTAFLASDLHKFDLQFGLPEPANFFTKVDENGGTQLPSPATPDPVNGSWATEISLDVEWVRATAPGAKIVLVEAPDWADLAGAVAWARDHSGAVAVSMSWDAYEDPSEISEDASIYSPADHGITYLAASGDLGNDFVGYPATSPDVVAVGGTDLVVSGGVYGSEDGWDGSGGGISSYESEPSYQQGLVIHSGGSVINPYGKRAMPDVAMIAGYPGVDVYDSYDDPSNPWSPIGGTEPGMPDLGRAGRHCG